MWSERLLVSVGGLCVVMKVEWDSRLTRHRWESECNVGMAMTYRHFPRKLWCAVRQGFLGDGHSMLLCLYVHNLSCEIHAVCHSFTDAVVLVVSSPDHTPSWRKGFWHTSSHFFFLLTWQYGILDYQSDLSFQKWMQSTGPQLLPQPIHNIIYYCAACVCITMNKLV